MGKNINGDRPTAFPLEQEKLPFTIPVVDEPRPKIAKLVAMITDRVPAKLKGVKGNDPEYWGLADLVTDEMADGRPQAQDHRAADEADQAGAGASAEAAGRHGLGGPDRIQLGESGREEPQPRKAVCPAPVRPRQRGVFQHAAQPDGRASPGGGLL